MDKCKNRGKGKVDYRVYREDSLLPPTRRILNESPPLQEKNSRRNKLTIGGFFKKVSSILDNPAGCDSSSSDHLDTYDRQKRRVKGKAAASKTTTPRLTGYASTIPPTIEYSPAGRYRPLHNNNNSHAYNNNNSNNNNNNGEMNNHLEVMMTSSQRSCSDGSASGGGSRNHKKDKVKARAEAKRDQLCVGDSSMDESSNEDVARNGNSKRRSRASRTERYLKRMCNGGQKAEDEQFRPIDAVPPLRTLPVYDCPPSHNIVGLGIKPNGDMYPLTELKTTNNNNNNNNFYSRQAHAIGVNPLVQQTLEYFSEFDRNMQQKIRRSHPAAPPVAYRRRVHPEESQSPNWSNVVPPKPPSRDHRSRLLLVNGTPVDQYQQMLVNQVRHGGYDKENGLPDRPMAYSPNTEVRNINEGVGYGSISPGSTVHKLTSPVSPPRSPLKESINTTGLGGRRFSSPIKKPRYPDPPLSNSPRFSPPKEPDPEPRRPSPNSRRSSKNLEEALCELEAIYNSLQLGDEELLDRAERRTEEEFLYKGLTVSPDPYAKDPSSARRKTWADSALLNHVKEEPEVPDRLRDDMAYRRMHPKERPASVDGPLSLSSISYLMTSPIPVRRDDVDPKRKPRRKEPDITLDDVVFRSRQYANNTLKIVEPQPPFGIPLGPITTGADSDYLHSNPPPPGGSRSPYVANPEPDLVTDDLAFRNLRKDALPSSSSRQPSPCFLSGSSPQHLYPQSFDWRKKRAVRSLSANLYGMINKPNSPLSEDLNAPRNYSPLDDYYDELRNRRTSDPEIMSVHWHRTEVNDRLEEDKDEDCRRIRLEDSAEDGKSEQKVSSELSSSCSTPPPVPSCDPPIVEPFTEQEISVYKKLCQDLENLVQLTKGIDETQQPQPLVLEEEEEVKPPFKEQSIEDYIYDNCKKAHEEDKKPDVILESRRKESTTKESEKIMGVEEEESKDTLDDVFYRDFRLAKLSGDWKESTPNRRNSLKSGSASGADNWEGMTHMKCNHKYNSMPAKTSSLLPFRLYGSKRKSNNRKSMCTIS